MHLEVWPLFTLVLPSVDSCPLLVCCLSFVCVSCLVRPYVPPGGSFVCLFLFVCVSVPYSTRLRAVLLFVCLFVSCPLARASSFVCSRVLSRASVNASGRFFCLFVCRAAVVMATQGPTGQAPIHAVSRGAVVGPARASLSV